MRSLPIEVHPKFSRATEPFVKMNIMDLQLETYKVTGADRIMTPALLVYPELVAANIDATLRAAGDDPDRWRPHIKTAKLAMTVRLMVKRGIRQFKCATTLELATACECGADDVLLAFSVVGANAERTLEIARQYPKTKISVLIESPVQAEFWLNTPIGVFVDLNPGMDRTGVLPGHSGVIEQMASLLGSQFRGLHYYDGHVSHFAENEAEKRIHEGYDTILSLVIDLERKGISVGEVITSGTPALPAALSYPGFRNSTFVHRVSPGTVVYNDLNSLKQLPAFGYEPAVLILSTVISQPADGVITCDAGHKSVSADSGVPTCAVIGSPDLVPGKPSEEHLPIQVSNGKKSPAIGEQLYLLPKHICPSVNNFDEAYVVENGRVVGIEPVTARGHEANRLS
jgi:D-serine deaminase-like pyridoxal phosphate-dependent protein